MILSFLQNLCLLSSSAKDVLFSKDIEEYLSSIKEDYDRTNRKFYLENIDLESLLPNKVLNQYQQTLESYIEKSVDKETLTYHQKYYSPAADNIHSGLLRCFINKDSLLSLIDFEKSKNLKQNQISTLKSFFPSNDNFADKIVYSMFGTITGRFTVDSGPRILTLKKEYRKLIGSVYKNSGPICLDFSSLEPRVCLLNDSNNTELCSNGSDIYKNISSVCHLDSVSRTNIKKLVSSYVHGYGKKSIQHTIESFDSSLSNKSNEIFDYLDKLFQKSKQEKILNEQFQRFGFIRNRFGRPIFPKSTNQENLYSLYIQSTGNDLSIFTFGKFIEYCHQKTKDLVRPIGLIHDSIMLDVPEEIAYNAKSLTKTCSDFAADLFQSCTTFGDNVESHQNTFPLSIQII